MSVAVLPAAGSSRRMGRPKLLLPFAGSTMLGCLVDSLRRGGVERVILVTGPDDERLQAWAEERAVEVAVNPDPSRGMLSSLWAGLEHAGGADRLAAQERSLLVTPADKPAIRPETVRRLIAAVEREGAELAVPVHRGERGHPLAIAPRLVGRILDLPLERGLRALLDEVQPRRLAVDDAGAVLDVDTPEDYERLRALADAAD